MKIKIITILVFSFLFFGFRFANAGLIINEIMYDLEGADSIESKSREWVEIYNPDSSEVIVGSAWRFFDGSANRTINGQEDFSIPAGVFVVFSGDKDTFLSDHPGFSGSVYDTGMTSLNNTGATLKILDENGVEVDSISYSSSQGANGNGNSLQKTSDSWIQASPTPGAENASSGSGGNGGGGGGNGGGSSSSSNDDDEEEEGKKVIKNPTMKAKILSNSLAFVGQPFGIKANILGYSNENVVLGRLYWNFGDGTYFEQKNNFEKFVHIYYYPGEYQLSLEYYASHFSKEPEVVSKMIVKVVPTTVVISRVGDATDFFIELTNESSNDIDISGWYIKAGVKNFFFPKNTVILAKKKMILGSRITGFSFQDKYNLKLYAITGELISDFNSKIEIEAPRSRAQIINSNTLKETKEVNISKEVSEQKEEINLGNGILNFGTNLTASAFLTDEENDKNFNNPRLFFWIFVALLLLSVGIVYYLRQNRNPEKVGDDFEILDE